MRFVIYLVVIITLTGCALSVAMHRTTYRSDVQSINFSGVSFNTYIERIIEKPLGAGFSVVVPLPPVIPVMMIDADDHTSFKLKSSTALPASIVGEVVFEICSGDFAMLSCAHTTPSSKLWVDKKTNIMNAFVNFSGNIKPQQTGRIRATVTLKNGDVQQQYQFLFQELKKIDAGVEMDAGYLGA